jgi:hypothetical protein
MNKRIQQLVEQANGSFGTGQEFAVVFGELEDFEKFAELIMKECGQWFNDRLVVEPHPNLPHRIERNRAVVGVMKEYNKHFGIEQ